MADVILPSSEHAVAEAIANASWRRQLRFWLVTAAALVLLLYLFSEILLPFVAGLVLAYFLDPVADRLERTGLSRVWATVLILLTFVIVLALGLVILIPLLVTQTADFAARLPEYLNKLQQLVTNFDPQWLE